MTKAFLTNMTVTTIPAHDGMFDPFYGKPIENQMELSMDVIVQGGEFSTQDIHQWVEYFPKKAIVKCEHCGQWGARYTACGYCGAAID